MACWNRFVLHSAASLHLSTPIAGLDSRMRQWHREIAVGSNRRKSISQKFTHRITMKIFEQIDKWHKSRAGYAVFGAVELLGAAAFVLWALGPDGGWLDWLCAVILAAGATRNFVTLARYRSTQ